MAKKKKFAKAGQDSTGYTGALATGASTKSPPKDPYIPETPEAWAVEGSTLDKPSKEWADWVDKKGKAAGFRGAKSPKKIAKKPYRRK